MAEQKKIPRRTRGKPTDVDRHVGKRVRTRRNLLGWSQEKLAGKLGLTFQQVQKYERGANRIGSGRLYQLALVLDVSVNYFFEELPDDASAVVPADPISENPHESRRLVKAYYAISDPAVRKRMLELMRSIGSEQE